ncbi:MAG: CHAT domain-containing protein [Prochlorothrix sp.]
MRRTGTPVNGQGQPEIWIEGGADRGAFLFHSFEAFGVEAGARVFFNPSESIEQIFSRVTGSDPSQILGTLGVKGSADLFLLNPNGLFFGPNARLELGGSFFATTGDQISFDNYQFSATAPTPPPPLLTINPPRAIEFGVTSPGPITVAGTGSQLRLVPTANPNLVARFVTPDRAARPAGLAVQPGQSLGLIGGPITLAGGNLTAEGGQILLGSVGAATGASAQRVQLEAPPGHPFWSLSYDGVQRLQPVRLLDSASIDTSGEGGGLVQIRGDSLELAGGSAILALTLGNTPGRGIDLQLAKSVTLGGINGFDLPSVIQTGVATGAMADAGAIEIAAQSLVLLDGAGIGSSTNGMGNGGSLNLTVADQILIQGQRRDGVGGLIESRVLRSGLGDAGDLSLRTGVLRLDDGAVITATTLGQGNAGNLSIAATDVQLRGRRGDRLRTFIATGVGRTGEGTAGNLQITTDRLWLQDGTLLSTSTDGQGVGGNLLVTARDWIRLEGQNLEGVGSALRSRASLRGVGNAGNLSVETANLFLRNGAFISAANLGQGEGGNISINVANTVSLAQNSQIIASNQGQGTGGNIRLEATTLSLWDHSAVSAATANARGGNITLNLGELLILAGGSYISAEAGTAQAGGDGGDIRITVPLIVALPQFGESLGTGNNDIIANAFQGRGGNIVIDAVSLLGFEVANVSQPRLDLSNNITASSQFGISSQPSISNRTQPLDRVVSLQERIQGSETVTAIDPCQSATRSTLQMLGHGGFPLSPLVFLRDQQPQQTFSTLRQPQGIGSGGELGIEGRKQQPPSPPQKSGDRDPIAPAIRAAQQADRAAHQWFERGQWELALEQWRSAEQGYRSAGNQLAGVQSRLNQLQMLQALGAYLQAEAMWSQFYPEFATIVDPQLQIQGFQSLAVLAQSREDWAMAQFWLEQGLAVADGLGTDQLTQTHGSTAQDASGLTPPLELPFITDLALPLEETPQATDQSSQLWLHLGNTLRLTGNSDLAQGYYQRSIDAAGRSTDQAQAQLNLMGLWVEQQRWDAVESQIPALNLLMERLPTNARTLTYHLHWVTLLLQLHQGSIDLATLPALPQIDQHLAHLVQTSGQLQNDRLRFYALAQRGYAQELLGQSAVAQDLTIEALSLAESIPHSDSLYLVLWQLGRILEDLGDRDAAIAAYRQAVRSLRALRPNLAASSLDFQISFRDRVEPLYRQLVALLLQPSDNSIPPQAHLREARNLIELLQIAELDDYFQDSCTVNQETTIDTLDDQAAVIYAIILNDRLEVIVSMADRPLIHQSVAVTASQLEFHAYQLLEFLTTPLQASQIQVLEELQSFYGWLVAPIQSVLEQNQVKTLIFVADGVLRTLPLSAFYDGQSYLVEHYNVALAPGLKVLEAQVPDSADRRLLVGGLSVGRDSFSPLPFVQQEIENITSLLPQNRLYFNESFTLSNLKTDRDPAEVIHLASHGEFGTQAEGTFILTWDGRLTIEDLGAIIRARSAMGTGVDLLVLSACKTATGDSRSVLGIAGMGIRSNARSVIAGLWPVNDEATSVFMEHFYQALVQPETTKAAAFRHAQLALMADRRFQSPFYWSPYILVGNWF